MLGTFFAGLLDHAHLFDQVYRSRQQWVRVIDAIPDAIVVHDALGNIVRINRRLPIELESSIQTHWPSYPRSLGIDCGKVAGFCPLCSDTEEGIEGPIELFADCSYLVSTTRMDRDPGADAQTSTSSWIFVNNWRLSGATASCSTAFKRGLFSAIQTGGWWKQIRRWRGCSVIRVSSSFWT